MKLRIKLAALAMAGSSAALVLAATPAMASSHAITGPEIAYGAIYGKAATANNPVLPVGWRGLVNAQGYFSPNGAPPKKGKLHIQHVGREADRSGDRRADQQPELQLEDMPLRRHDNRRLRRGGQQEHRRFRLDIGSGRGAGLLRRVWAEVHIWPAQKPMQHQPERARAVHGGRRHLRVERRAQGVASLALRPRR